MSAQVVRVVQGPTKVVVVPRAVGPRGPQGEAGPAGEAGQDGSDGTPGTTFEVGTGAPSAPSAPGDLYLDAVTGDLYRWDQT